jgi:hypothetical protein
VPCIRLRPVKNRMILCDGLTASLSPHIGRAPVQPGMNDPQNDMFVVRDRRSTCPSGLEVRESGHRPCRRDAQWTISARDVLSSMRRRPEIFPSKPILVVPNGYDCWPALCRPLHWLALRRPGSWPLNWRQPHGIIAKSGISRQLSIRGGRWFDPTTAHQSLRHWVPPQE